MLTTIVEHAVELSGADGGSLMEYDEETRLFRVRTAYGTSDRRARAPQGDAASTSTSRWSAGPPPRDPVQVADLSEIERDPHLQVLFDAGWRSVVAIPLVRPTAIVGALVVRRRRRAPSVTRRATC